MLPPEEYENVASQAESHIQLTIENFTISESEALVYGHVVRVFRGNKKLLDAKINLRVPCYSKNEPGPPDGISRISVESLSRGCVLEALLNNTPTGPVIPLGLCIILQTSTALPQLPLSTNGSQLPIKKNIHVLILTIAILSILTGLYFFLR